MSPGDYNAIRSNPSISDISSTTSFINTAHVLRGIVLEINRRFRFDDETEAVSFSILKVSVKINRYPIVCTHVLTMALPTSRRSNSWSIPFQASLMHDPKPVPWTLTSPSDTDSIQDSARDDTPRQRRSSESHDPDWANSRKSWEHF